MSIARSCSHSGLVPVKSHLSLGKLISLFTKGMSDGMGVNLICGESETASVPVASALRWRGLDNQRPETEGLIGQGPVRRTRSQRSFPERFSPEIKMFVSGLGEKRFLRSFPIAPPSSMGARLGEQKQSLSNC
ncbi:hypothetical protein V2G26_001591 [Clonostachys chloroleuca]